MQMDFTEEKEGAFVYRLDGEDMNAAIERYRGQGGLRTQRLVRVMEWLVRLTKFSSGIMSLADNQGTLLVVWWARPMIEWRERVGDIWVTAGGRDEKVDHLYVVDDD